MRVWAVTGDDRWSSPREAARQTGDLATAEARLAGDDPWVAWREGPRPYRKTAWWSSAMGVSP